VRNALLAAAAASIVLAVAGPAAANGRFPASNQLLFSPSNGQLVIERTTFGILRSYDYGTTWSWLCEDSLGLPPTSNEDPSLALCKNNTLLAGLSLGLEVSPDTGCSWSTQGGGLAGQLVKDLDIPPGTPDTALAITSTFEPDAGTDGGQGYTQNIFTSTDDGAHWTITGAIDPAATVTTLEVAPTDPQRIYVSAYRGEGMARTVSIFVSANAGQTWTEHPITQLDPNTETAVYIAAVDPNNEDLVYVRSAGASRLFVTSNGASTFQVAFALPESDQMLGFALSQDGSKVFLGGANTGLFSASATDLQFTSVLQHEPDGGTRMIHVQCLATHGADLWACSDEPSGFIAGVSQDDGVTFTAKLHLTTIAGPAACPASTTSAICTETDVDAAIPYNPFGSLCTNLGACYDAGPPQPLQLACDEAGACASTSSSSGGGSGGGSGSGSGGGDAGTGGSGSPGKSSCGCSVVGGSGAAGALVGVGVALLAVRRRRRR
jgi:MYXO-CTERM domain-containing protein